VTFQNYSSSGAGGGQNSNPLKTIAQVTDESLGMDGNASYFALQAHISHIRQENAWYLEGNFLTLGTQHVQMMDATRN
jgi:hypothetical protein